MSALTDRTNDHRVRVAPTAGLEILFRDGPVRRAFLLRRQRSRRLPHKILSFFFPLLRPVEDPADDDEGHLKGYGSRIGERGHDSIIAPTAKRPGAGIRAAAL